MYEFASISPSSEVRKSLRVDEVRWAERRIPLSRGSHVTGRVSPGAGRPSIAFESMNERRAIERILGFPEVQLVLSQPFTVHYQWEGHRRRYTPDLLIIAQPVSAWLRRHGFGPLTVVEIKRDIEAVSRELIEARLRVAQLATGMPVVLATPSANANAAAGGAT